MADILGFPQGNRPGDPYPPPQEVNPNSPPDELPRMQILEEAARLVCVDRHHQHGDASKNIGLTGDLWSVVAGRRLDAHDVCLMNVMQKISRILCGHRNKDNYSDVAGYIALAWELSDGNAGR
jgi:hypothetical protein